MRLLRKIVSVSLAVGALFFGSGLVLAPPAHIGALVTLAVLAVVMLAAAVLVWPRPTRPWQIDAMIADRLR